MRRTTLPTLAAACALFAALVACGGDPQPKFTKSPTPTHTMSASPASPTPTDPTPPEMPAAAKKHTVAGAKAFTRYVWRVVNYTQTTLDAAPLRPLLSKGCDGCNGGLAGIERLTKAHAKVHGGTYTVDRFRTERLLAGNTRLIRLTFRVANTREVIRYPGKKKDDVYKPGVVTDQWVLSPRPAGWMVISWDVLQ